jgi:hypothetical protein
MEAHAKTTRRTGVNRVGLRTASTMAMAMAVVPGAVPAATATDTKGARLGRLRDGTGQGTDGLVPQARWSPASRAELAPRARSGTIALH